MAKTLAYRLFTIWADITEWNAKIAAANAAMALEQAEKVCLLPAEAVFAKKVYRALSR